MDENGVIMNEYNIRFDRKKENNKIKRRNERKKNVCKKKNLKKKVQKIKESPLDRLKCDQYS